MKKTILTGLIFLASTSGADTIKCSFAEPFLDTTFSMSKSTLTYSEEGKSKTIKNVAFEIRAPGEFALVKNGKVLQTLRLTYSGSDGSSSTIFPYEVQDSSLLARVTANNGVGGCASDYLKSSPGEP